MSGLKIQMCNPGEVVVLVWRTNLRVARDSIRRRSCALMKRDVSKLGGGEVGIARRDLKSLIAFREVSRSPRTVVQLLHFRIGVNLVMSSLEAWCGISE
jgi:hypothetical protein